MNRFIGSERKEAGTESRAVARSRVYVWYTLVFLLLSLVMLSQFILYKKTLLTTDDGYLQWYSELVKFKHVMSDLFHGKGFSLWSWDTGLGADWIGNYATIFCDPFNYIALFFSNEKMDIAYTVIGMVKMYVAGIGMLAFLRYHKHPRLFCLVGAVGYVFCAWSSFGLYHIFFITQLVVFPLLILGVDKVWDGKSPLTLILSVTASICISLYFSWMSAIFVCIYIIVKFFMCNKMTEKGLLRKFFFMLIRYIFYAVVGVLLSAPILFPALYTLLNASSGSGVDSQILPNIKQLFRFIPSIAGRYDIYNYTALGTNPLFVIMIPAMVLSWREKKTSVRMFFISVITAFFPVLQSVMNGFSYPAGRWCYIFAFFLTFAAIDCIGTDIIKTEKYRSGLRIWLSVIAIVSILALLLRMITSSDIVIVLMNLLFCALFYSLISKKELIWRRKRYYMVGLTLLNIAMVLLITFNPGTQRLYRYMTVGDAYEAYNSCGLKAARKIEDTDFFRVDSVERPNFNGENIPVTTTSANTSIYHEVPSVSLYMSTIDDSWLTFNYLLGNNSGCFRRVCTSSNDNRSRMDFLLGVKYFLGDNKNKGYKLSQYAGYAFAPMTKKKGVSILKSKYNAGLGYVYSDMISESDFMTYSALEREQILMQSILVPDGDMKTVTSAKEVKKETLQLDDRKIPSRLQGSKDAEVQAGQLLVKGVNAWVGVEIGQEITNSEVYVVFRNLKRKATTADEQWAIRKQKTEEYWKQEKKVLFDTSELAKADFYANFLSKTPYGNFDISVEKGNVKKCLLNTEGEPRAIRDVDDYMVNLGYMEKCSGTISCWFQDTGLYTYDSIDVIAVPQNNFDLQAQRLERNRLQVTEYGDNRVVGEVNAEKAGLLYLSILYNDGWSIYVDGKKADRVYHVNTAFTGVEVPAGRHRIELIYRPVGFRLSIIFFITGLLAILVIAVYYSIRRRKKISEPLQKTEDENAGQ